MLTLERAREALRYDPETGVLTWAISRPGQRIGALAECRKDGYLVVRLEPPLVQRENKYISGCLIRSSMPSLLGAPPKKCTLLTARCCREKN